MIYQNDVNKNLTVKMNSVSPACVINAEKITQCIVSKSEIETTPYQKTTHLMIYNMKRFLFITAILSLIFLTNIVKADDYPAKDTIVPLSIPRCYLNMPEQECQEWYPWQYFSRTIDFNSDMHPDWPWGPRTFKCPITVSYRVRQCKTDNFMHQYDLLNMVFNWNYRVWIFEEFDYVYPCREALEILKGSEVEVSSFLNSLYDAVYEDLLIILHSEYFATLEELDKIYAGRYEHYKHSPCNETDPNNPWNQDPITVVTAKSSCQGNCITWAYNDIIIWKDVETEIPTYYEVCIAPDLQTIANLYNNGDTNGIAIEPLAESDIVELNNYIQTEINPGIPEMEHKIPIFNYGIPKMRISKVPCAEDFCCIYKINICQDDDGKAILYNKAVEGTVPQQCVNADPVPCPPSVYPVPMYPCITNCEISSSQQSPHSVINNNISKINVVPNPSNGDTKLTFMVTTAGNLNVTLVNLEGGELIEIYNAYTESGEFTKTFSMTKFSRGVYFLKINYNGTIKIHQLIRN